MAKTQFKPGDQVVVTSNPDATIYYIKSLHEGGVARLAYINSNNKELNAGEVDVSLLQYPSLAQLQRDQ